MMAHVYINQSALCSTCTTCNFCESDWSKRWHHRSQNGKLETGRMYVTLCGYNLPWEDLSAAQKNSLTHRYQSGCDCKIIHCTSLPCPISTTDACLWTDNGQNLACIKRHGSCAWK